MRHIVLPTVLCLTTALVGQTANLRVAGFTDPELPSPPGWGSSTVPTNKFGALLFEPEAESHTLFFAHTTIDDSVSGASTARGLIEIYPFLAPPNATWSVAHPAVAAVPATFAGSAALVVPPARVAAHLGSFLAARPEERNAFGSWSESAAASILTWDPAWDCGLPHDERRAWHGNWSGTPPQVFDISEVGRNAVVLAANFAAPGQQMPGLDAIENLLVEEYGFLIHVQAASISWPAGQENPPRVRFSQSVVMRRRSIREHVEDDRRLLMGPWRWCPSPFDPTHFVHLAGRGEWLQVQMPFPVSGTVALVETTNGWVQRLQEPNPAGLVPDVGMYRFPLSGISSFAYITLPPPEYGPPALLTPLHNYAGGFAVSVYAFNPHAEHVPPNPPQ